MDAKIFAKILSGRLAQVLEDLVDINQTGFMPGEVTDINIRHLFLNLFIPHDNPVSRVIASLDPEKAYDLVKWPSSLWVWPQISLLVPLQELKINVVPYR